MNEKTESAVNAIAALRREVETITAERNRMVDRWEKQDAELASLRKQLDDAVRKADRLDRWSKEHGGRYWEARYRDEAADNAKKDAALRRIEQNSEPGSRNNRIARDALGIEPVDPTLTPALQEADHFADAGKMVAAPAPAISGGETRWCDCLKRYVAACGCPLAAAGQKP